MDHIIETLPPESVGFINKPIRTRRAKKAIKRKLVKYLVILALCLASIMFAIYVVNEFFEQYTLNFQSPIKLQTPVEIKNREVPQTHQVISTAHAQEIPAPAKDSVDEIVDKIYRLESSGGKNDPCVRDGLGFNGYGYIPGSCYSSHQQVRALVTAWVMKRYDMPLGQLLCGYNLGFSGGHKSCDYYDNYLSLN